MPYVLIVVGSAIVSAFVGVWIRHRLPLISAALVQIWNVTVVVVAAALVAVLAVWAVTLAFGEPQDAELVEKVYFALGAAAFAALGEWWLKVVDRFSASWLTKRTLCPRYQRRFPAQPSEPQSAVEAYRSVRDTCGLETITFGSLKAMLEAVKRVS